MMKATAIVVLVFILGITGLPTATATNSGEYVSEFSEPGETYSVDRYQSIFPSLITNLVSAMPTICSSWVATITSLAFSWASSDISLTISLPVA